MMPCCSVSLFKLKLSASTSRSARMPPFFRRTVSLRISAIGTKRCVDASAPFFRERIVLLMPALRDFLSAIILFRENIAEEREVASRITIRFDAARIDRTFGFGYGVPWIERILGLGCSRLRRPGIDDCFDRRAVQNGT